MFCNSIDIRLSQWKKDIPNALFEKIRTIVLTTLTFLTILTISLSDLFNTRLYEIAKFLYRHTQFPQGPKSNHHTETRPTLQTSSSPCSSITRQSLSTTPTRIISNIIHLRRNLKHTPREIPHLIIIHQQKIRRLPPVTPTIIRRKPQATVATYRVCFIQQSCCRHQYRRAT